MTGHLEAPGRSFLKTNQETKEFTFRRRDRTPGEICVDVQVVVGLATSLRLCWELLEDDMALSARRVN